MITTTAANNPPFIKGLDLNRGFYKETVKPLLDKHFGGLPYSASLIGYGSDVIGMDTAQSTDHNWGPRMQIFVDEGEFIPRIDECLRQNLPPEYRGYPVNFTDKRYDATQSMLKTDAGPINHLIEIKSFEDYLKNRYSIDKIIGFSNQDWLRFNDQQLLEITSGEVFHDGLNKLNRTREELKLYPTEIWKLRMAVLWDYISNKEAFVGRSSSWMILSD